MSRFRPSNQPCVQVHASTTDAPGPRILHLLAGTGWGGAEHMGTALHRLSQAHGHDSRLEAPRLPSAPAALIEQLAAPPAPDEARASIWALRARKRARAFAPDLVHAHLATPGLIGAACIIAGRAPLVLTFQLLPESERFPSDYVLRLPGAWMLRAAAQRRAPCTLVAVSEADRTRLVRRLPGTCIALVPNRPQPPLLAAEPARVLHYPAGAVRLLSVGRLVAQKGFDTMLEALAAPRLRALPWHWLIVGEGSERAALEREIAAYGLSERVQLLGALPSHGLFAQADLVLCPSRYEGAPLVPQEALAESAPVLLSPIPVHRDFCRNAPQALLPELQSAWPARLQPLLESADVRSQLRRALQPLAQRLNPEALWDDYARVYEQTLARAAQLHQGSIGLP